MPSESSTVASSNSTVFGRAGRVPTAITMFSAVTWRLAPSLRRDATVCGVDEPRGAVQHRDVVARELVADDVDLALDDGLRAPEEILDGDVVLDPVALPVQLPLGMPVRYTTASRSVLDGIVPVLMHTPPTMRCARRSRHACRAWPPGSRPSARPGRSRSRADRSRRPCSAETTHPRHRRGSLIIIVAW